MKISYFLKRRSRPSTLKCFHIPFVLNCKSTGNSFIPIGSSIIRTSVQNTAVGFCLFALPSKINFKCAENVKPFQWIVERDYTVPESGLNDEANVLTKH